MLFAVSPLHLKFIELADRWKLVVFVSLTLFSMIIGRHNFNPFISVIFWTPFYLLGIWCAMNYERLKNAATLNVQCLFCVTMLYVALLVSMRCGAVWLHDYGAFNLFALRLPLLAVISKMLICVSLLYVFMWLNNSSIKIIKRILSLFATYSFAIFFLHQFAILHLERHSHKTFLADLNFVELHVWIILCSIAVCFLCMMVAWMVKQLTGKYSRMVIGVN